MWPPADQMWAAWLDRTREEVVDKNIVSKGVYRADYRRDRYSASRPRLNPGVALTVTLLSSLGLWWGIWLIVSSLAAGW